MIPIVLVLQVRIQQLKMVHVLPVHHQVIVCHVVQQPVPLAITMPQLPVLVVVRHTNTIIQASVMIADRFCVLLVQQPVALPVATMLDKHQTALALVLSIIMEVRA